jgi:hypothetical protein
MVQTKERLLSTIRALLEMTEARGCTKAEAAAASTKALELMCKYGISLNDLTAPVPPQTFSPSATTAQARKTRWGTPQRTPEEDEKVRKMWETFSRKRGGGWSPLRRFVRTIVGYAAVGFAIWAFEGFHYNQGSQSAERRVEARINAIANSHKLTSHGREKTVVQTSPIPQTQ